MRSVVALVAAQSPAEPTLWLELRRYLILSCRRVTPRSARDLAGGSHGAELCERGMGAAASRSRQSRRSVHVHWTHSAGGALQHERARERTYGPVHNACDLRGTDRSTLALECG